MDWATVGAISRSSFFPCLMASVSLPNTSFGNFVRICRAPNVLMPKYSATEEGRGPPLLYPAPLLAALMTALRPAMAETADRRDVLGIGLKSFRCKVGSEDCSSVTPSPSKIVQKQHKTASVKHEIKQNSGKCATICVKSAENAAHLSLEAGGAEQMANLTTLTGNSQG
jgi:hypothetical protein